jgi:DNA-binding CsgD family transcriptional regulator
MSVDAAGTDARAVDDPRPRLLGRDLELAQLYGLIDAIGVHGGALVVRGDAGIGKSALLEAAADRARERDVAVVTAAGIQSEVSFAFAGLHQLLLPFLDARDRLADPQRRALETAFGLADGDSPDPFLVGLAALGLLTGADSKNALLLLVEDAQWLDRRSSEVLGFVARRLEHEPVIVLLAVRDGVASVIDEFDIPELRIDGLDEATSRALLAQTSPGLSSDLSARIMDEAAGNPLALIELPAASEEIRAGTTAELLPLSERLEQAFAARFAGLPSETREFLLLSSLEDGEIPELCDNTFFHPAVAAGLGTIEHDRFRFRHPLIRSAVAHAATTEERRRAHTALAEALAGQPDRAVWHRAAATAAPDERMAAAMDAAAERSLARGSGDAALAALERGAELSTDPASRAERLFRAGDLAFDLGRSDRGAGLFREAQRLGLPPHQRALASFQVEMIESTWSGAPTILGFARIAQELATSGHDLQALQALAMIALRAYWENLDQDTRRHVARVIEQLAVAADDPKRLSTLALFDPVGQGSATLRRVRHTAPFDVPDPDEQVSIGTAASAVWAVDLALPFLRAAAAGYRAEGRLGLLAQTLISQAWAELHEGAVRVAITSAAEAVELSAEIGLDRSAAVGQLTQAIAAVEMGSDETAEKLISAAEAALLPLGANPLLGVAAMARGRQALAHERFSVAYEQLLRIFDPTDMAHGQLVGGWVLADLTEAAVHGGGDRALVRRLLHDWEDIAEATGASLLDVQLRYARAILAEEHNAEALFVAAMSPGANRWPFYVARARLEFGSWLRRQQRVTQSRKPLREAARSFDALGLIRLAERARRELRASGESLRHQKPEAWTQLTPQEMQIARLATEGLSNREIGERLYLSHRTVGSHLYRLFPKLGITSRIQLREALEPPAH